MTTIDVTPAYVAGPPQFVTDSDRLAIVEQELAEIRAKIAELQSKAWDLCGIKLELDLAKQHHPIHNTVDASNLPADYPVAKECMLCEFPW